MQFLQTIVFLKLVQRENIGLPVFHSIQPPGQSQRMLAHEVHIGRNVSNY